MKKTTTTPIGIVNQIELIVIEEDGERWVPIKPICIALSINHQTQMNKIQADRFWRSVVALRATTGSDGKDYKMACLPYKFIFGWLFTINPKNVKTEARDLIQAYRLECHEVLYNHFTAADRFLRQKQDLVREKTQYLKTVRTNFREAKEKLREAQHDLEGIVEYSMNDWLQNGMQMQIEFYDK